MATTATRTSSWTPELIGASELWMSKRVQDLFFEGNVYLYLLKQKGRIQTGRYNKTHVIPISETQSDLPTTYADLDVIDFVRPEGPEAATYTYGQYVLGIPWSEVQEADNYGPSQNVDLLGFYIDNKMETFVKQVNYDMIHGNSQDSLKFLGLEQAVAPYNHDTTYNANGFPFTTRRQACRQATNTYAGIARTGSTTLTNWENCSVSFDESYNDSSTGSASWGAGDSRFGFTTNQAPLPALKALDRLWMACCWGDSKPDCMLSDHTPFLDYCNAYKQTIQYVKTSETQQGADLGIPHIMHNGMMWGVDPEATTSGLIGDGVAAKSAVWLLTMSTHFLLMQEGWNFDLRAWMDVPQQLARVSTIKCRGFHECRDPRKNGVAFSYGEA